jgi:hypothetical protein
LENRDWSDDIDGNLDGAVTIISTVVGIGLVCLATGVIVKTLQDITGSNYEYCLECDLSKATTVDGLCPEHIWDSLPINKTHIDIKIGVYEGHEVRIEKNPIKRPGYEWDYVVFSHSKVIVEGNTILLTLEENPHYSKVRKTANVVDTKLNTLADKIATKVAARVLKNREKGNK